ncbi:GP88 family protein [Thermomonospora cellulosilytica]|uniref:Gene product 88 domain-containing protein n=1 Tax=Thermomonospora cellulosilytica TaxID=1411118 RepID=A0A7W3N1U3_9ACTN|nr:hypothetical protein [Thermomonospora cellulosilytica]MBA9005975.1 hypothetical protein [Thermomonospora cellulosilytica]
MTTTATLPTPTRRRRRRRLRRPDRLLGQNSELRADGVWNWTLPALATRLPDGRTVSTCPAAGVCALACYARSGTYNFPAVAERHQANLAYVLDDLPGWQRQMAAELAHQRHRGGWIRIHDSGDFFSDHYLAAWLRIMAFRPYVNFYCYTKEVSRFRRLVEPAPPRNFWWVYSYGGREDHLIRPGIDRVADVFPDEESIRAAGWHSQNASDLLAVLGPAPVGIPANNIPHLRRRQGDRTFRQWQAELDARRAARRRAHSPHTAQGER